MDFNEDRWGSVSRKMDTSVEGGKITKDILENDVGVYVERGETSRVYFQNIGKYIVLIFRQDDFRNLSNKAFTIRAPDIRRKWRLCFEQCHGV